MVHLLHMRSNRLKEIKDAIAEQNLILTENFFTYIQQNPQNNEISIDN